MSFAVVALVLGLVLLIAAAGLFLRASRRDAGRPETARRAQASAKPTKGTASTTSGSAPDVEGVAGITAPVDLTGEVESDGVAEGNAENTGDATTSGTDAIGYVAGVLAEDATGNFSGRRGRRNWATAHGFEYTREDAFLTAEWPVSLVRELSPTDSGPVARDVVSGFLDGHQLHIADVAGATVFALRRGAYSPVNVHISTSAAMPAGMRHDSALDRGTFTVYTTDPRAMARMLDIRLENALAGLTGAVRDVAFSGAWVTVRGPRRIDADRWDAFLPYLLILDAASRVLPPMVTTAALDIAVADPTRPRPSSGVRVAVPAVAGGGASAPGAEGKGTRRAGSAEGPENFRSSGNSASFAGSSRNFESTGSTGGIQDAAGGNAPKQPRPGYLRAVPDAPVTTAAEPGAGGASDDGSEGSPAGESAEGSTPGTAAGESASPQSAPGKHPPVERPTVPVDFPTRAQGKVLGEADLEGIWPEDVAEDGLTSIPALGEEPSPPPEPGRGDPRIVRTGDAATIFTDAPGDEVSLGDTEIGEAEVVDVEIVDAEVVDPED